jgi:hypothetical protein
VEGGGRRAGSSLMRCWESRDEAAPLSAAGKTASSVFSHLAADDGADAPACRNITRNVRAALTASIFFSARRTKMQSFFKAIFSFPFPDFLLVIFCL